MVLGNRRVIINDACCLIDLHKVGLIQPMLALPFDFHIALPVRRNELLSISDAEWAVYEAVGLQSIDMPGPQVLRAFQMREMHAELSAEDCFSLVLAQETPAGMLLTGDAALRRIAEQRYGVEVHGVLWVADHLVENSIIDGDTACRCLEQWQQDPLVRLPTQMITARIRRWKPF